MITDEQARDAASRIAAIELIDFDADARTLLQWAAQEFARRDAERIERAKPIDAEWCKSHEAIQVDDGALFRWKFGCVRVDWDDFNGTTIDESSGEIVYLPTITTRGQLLDLLSAMKGGA